MKVKLIENVSSSVVPNAFSHHDDQCSADADSDRSPNRRGADSVGEALEGEHLHEVTTLGADRASDTHLLLPL